MTNYLDESAVQTMKMEYVMINNAHAKNPTKDWTCVGLVEIGYQHKDGDIVYANQTYKLIGDNPNTLLPQMFSQFNSLVGDQRVLESLYNESINSKVNSQTTSQD